LIRSADSYPVTTTTISSHHTGFQGMPGGPGREARNLTGMLEATVRDPQVKAPAPD